MKSALICVTIFALCVASSLATLYTWNNMEGGSWKTGSNWTPEGVPGVNDDAYFPYINGMPTDQVDLTLDGDIVVNSLTVEYYSFVFKTGSLVVKNDCFLNGGWLYRINVTLEGNATFASTGSGESGIACDSCVINVKGSLRVSSSQSGNTELINNAIFVNHPGATMRIVYEGFRVTDQVATLINYGTLIFEGILATYPDTPWGDPPVAETASWKSLENYGEIRIESGNSPIGVPVYNDIRTWNFMNGKITLKMVQESTANTERRVFDTNYEYNDAISSGGQHNYYEANIGADVHFVFAQAEVLPGETERPFNPKAGDFFPVFANFHKFTGSFKTITFEGLASGLALGRMTVQDDSTQLYHTGVVICESSDTACINASGPTPGAQQTPGASPTGTQSPSSTNPATPSSRTPGTSITSSASLIELGVMTVVAFAALLC